MIGWLVAEVPLAGQHERHAVLVGGREDLVVTHGAARLDDGDGARLGRFVELALNVQGVSPVELTCERVRRGRRGLGGLSSKRRQ